MFNWAQFILLAFFWGGSFVAIEKVLGGTTPIWGAFLRVAGAAIFILLMFRKKCFEISFLKAWRSYIVGILGIGIPFSLLFWGEKSVSPGLASILNGTVPIWTMILGAQFFKTDNPASFNRVLGLLLGIAGVFIIFYPQVAFSGSGQELWGIIAIVLMAMFYALSALLNRVLMSSTKVPFASNLYHQLVGSVVYLVLLALFIEGLPSTSILQSPSALISTLYLSIFSTGLALWMFFYLMKTWSAVRTVSVTYLVPVVSIVLDYFLNGNVLRSNEFGGMALILTAVFLIQSNISLINLSRLIPRREV